MVIGVVGASTREEHTKEMPKETKRKGHSLVFGVDPVLSSAIFHAVVGDIRVVEALLALACNLSKLDALDDSVQDEPDLLVGPLRLAHHLEMCSLLLKALSRWRKLLVS